MALRPDANDEDPHVMSALNAPELCNYCGVVIDSGRPCVTDGEFNHCPNKQIGADVAGVSETSNAARPQGNGGMK
jgi:hypothetical protein